MAVRLLGKHTGRRLPVFIRADASMMPATA
jgi:hypothetical protein